ncbi:MAG: hypothetical protein ACRCV7_06265 [Culicoidibacterales bacterium]
MEKINKWIDNLLKSRKFLLFLSLTFALLLFFNVNQNLNFIVLENTVDYTMNDVKLEVELNNDSQLLEGNPSTINFRINGKKADVERFKTERDIKAKIDVRDRFGENLIFPITYTSEKNYNVVITPTTKEVSVNVYKKMMIEKEIQIISPVLKEGFKLKDPPVIFDVNHNIVKIIQITGAEKQIQRIKAVEFRFTPQSVEGEKIEKIEPHFLDELGNTVSIESKQYTIQYTVEKIA